MKRIGILGHLIQASDLKRGSKLLKVIPDRLLEEVMKNLKGKRGVFFASKFNAFDQVDGYLMAVLLTASQVMNLPREFVQKRIIDALVIAQEKFGIELVQLGALTKSVTGAGQWIVQQGVYKGFVNHGDALTAAITIEAVEKIAKIKEIDLAKASIGIVGAYGTIGEAVSRILVPICDKAILVGRNMEGFKKLKDAVSSNYCLMTNDLTTVKEADIIITATNHPSALLSSSHLKQGVVIVDVSTPPNVSKTVTNERPDILRIDGGLVSNAGINLGFQIGPPKGAMYACVAEVIMQALENEQKSYVGPVDLDHLEITQKWSKKWGFKLAPFTCFGKIIPELGGKK